MKHSQRKYCGKKLVERVGKTTSKCYRDAFAHVVVGLNLPEEYYNEISWGLQLLRSGQELYAVDPILSEESLRKIKEAIDEEYLARLKSLSSKDIEDILWVHEKSKINRAPRTVEALKSELINREILGDKSNLF
jgi:hypothetical protein